MSMRKNKSNFQNAAFLSTRDIKILLDFYLRSDLKLEVPPISILLLNYIRNRNWGEKMRTLPWKYLIEEWIF